MGDTGTPLGADRRLAALFPGEAASPGRRWPRRVSAYFGGAAVVALVVGVLFATGAFGASGSSYTTATAGPAQVDAQQTGVATIEPVAQATVAFPVSGTVASVNVALGQPVQAGGTLASLDTTALTTTLHTKQAARAQAQLTLSRALSGQSISLGTGNGGGLGAGAGAAGASTNATTSAARTTGTSAIVLTAAPVDPKLTADEQAVLAAQQHVDAALADAATAITSETSACSASVSPSPPPSPSDIAACQQAIAAVTTAQQAVSDAQHALAAASSSLDAYLAQLAPTRPPTAPPTTPPPPSSPRTGGSAATGAPTGGGSSRSTTSGGSGTGRASGGGTSAPSAADLVAAQQAVDAANAAVAAAQQSIDQATVSSPIAGTVVAVNMKVGDHVTAASSTANIVVQGSGGYEITTTVNVDDIPQVAIGEDATVVPDGTHRTLDGKVVAISVAPAATTTTTTLYRVVVGLTDPTAALQNGATGTVSIVTKQARAAVAVPTSAVTTIRNRHFVIVLHGSHTTATPVQVGVPGSRWTQITSGLRAGQQVVLADHGAPLPGSATASTNGTQTNPFGGFGRFGGRGLGGFGGRGGRGQ